MSNNTIPIIVLPSPSIPTPGDTITVTVTMNEQADSDQAVAITSSPAGFYSSIPSQVTVLNGASQVTFNATLSTGASGSSTITATCNAHSKTAVVRTAA